jgi:predicted metal-dependent hydrolase
MPEAIQTVPEIGPVIFADSLRAKRLSITIKLDGTVRVTIPSGVSRSTAKKFLQSKILWVRKHLDRLQKSRQNHTVPAPINKTKAKAFLSERLRYLAQKHGYTYNRIFIRNQKTRWGSCSGKNNISLNMNLMRLPQELQDYVILHELVHTRHKNHSRKFWDHVDKLVGDSKKLKKELKKYRLGRI